MVIDHRGNVALRKIGSPVGFVWFRWECLDDEIAKLTGCVPSGVYTKGPRKGKPKYDGKPVVAYVTETEMFAERRRYEAETGNCAECGGDGQMYAGWNHKEGTRWRPCAKCNATGKPLHVGTA